MDCRVKPGNDEGFACLMACKKYGCRLLTGLPNPAVIIVTNDGTTTRERDRAELVLDYTLGSGLRSPEVSALGRPQAGAYSLGIAQSSPINRAFSLGFDIARPTIRPMKYRLCRVPLRIKWL